MSRLFLFRLCLLLFTLTSCGTGTWTSQNQGWQTGALQADNLGGTLSLRINEIMTTPTHSKTGEYIEFYNPTDAPASLTGLIIDDGDSRDVLHLRSGPVRIAPFGYALVIDPNFDDDFEIPQGVPVYTTRDRAIGNGLSNSDPITLLTPDEQVIDSILPMPTTTAVARERKAWQLADRKSAWRFVLGGSPGRRNLLAPSDRLRIRFTHPGDDIETIDALVDFIDEAVFSLDCAIYQMNHPEVMDALLRAHQRGVAVRIVTDSTFYDRPDYFDGYVPLEAAGIPVVPDERSSEQHNKFLVADLERVWLGSFNPTLNPSSDSVVELRSTALAAELVDEVDEMMHGIFGVWKTSARIEDYVIDDTDVTLLASPTDDIEEKIVEAIRNARHSIHFLAFGMTLDSIGAALIERHRAGVEVRGAMNWLHATHRGSEWGGFVDAGMDVRRSPHSMLMHHKLVIVDGGTPDALVITGSFNFSTRAETRNDETMLFIRNPRIAAASEGAFASVMRGSDPGETFERGTLAMTEVSQGEASWVEITNFGSEPVSLTGLTLTSQEHVASVPGGWLAAGQRVVVPFTGLGGCDPVWLLGASETPLDGYAPRSPANGTTTTHHRAGPVSWQLAAPSAGK